MGLHTEWIHYGNDQFKGYLAQPSRDVGSLPAILVIQEIWGIDEHIEDVTRRFAQAGYVAFAPDLYAKNGNRPDELSFDRLEALKRFLDTIPPTAWRDTEERESYLLKLPQPDQQQVRESVETVFGTVLGNMEAFLEPLASAVSFLRNEYPMTKNQSVGSVGYCMGGALSALLACKVTGFARSCDLLWDGSPCGTADGHSMSADRFLRRAGSKNYGWGARLCASDAGSGEVL